MTCHIVLGKHKCQGRVTTINMRKITEVELSTCFNIHLEVNFLSTKNESALSTKNSLVAFDCLRQELNHNSNVKISM